MQATALPNATREWSGHDLSSSTLLVLAPVVLGVLTWLDVELTDRLGFYFGVCFVLVSVSGALAAADTALFTAGVLPPLLMMVMIAAVVVVAPHAIAEPSLAADAGALQRTVAGVVAHAVALGAGHVAALAIIGFRLWGRARIEAA